MATCRSCGAPVVFAPSATSDKTMILDAKVERRIVFEEELQDFGTGPYGEQLYVKAGIDSARVVDTYVDHHATCPEAEAWRRSGQVTTP